MRNVRTGGLAVLAAAMLLAGLTAAASAGRLSFSTRSIRVVFSELEFKNVEEAPTLTVRCRVTLEGTLHSSTIAKVQRALIGHITRAAVGHPCAQNEAWIHNGTENPLALGAPASSLPWHLTYEGFTGTLPEITGVKILMTGIRMTIDNPGSCLAVYGEASENIINVLQVAGATVGGFLTEPSNALIKRSGTGFFCPNRIKWEGVGAVTVLGTTTRISITLI